MSTRVLVDGDNIFLNHKKIPKLLDQLVGKTVFVIDNAGFSYWFEKEAKNREFPINVLVQSGEGLKNKSKHGLKKHFITDNQIEERWYVTNAAIPDEQTQPDLMKLTPIKVFDHEFKHVQTLTGSFDD